MASPVKDFRNPGLRKVHFEQLLSYIDERKDQGWHYGRKDQFETRHTELETWVKRIIEMFEK